MRACRPVAQSQIVSAHLKKSPYRSARCDRVTPRKLRCSLPGLRETLFAVEQVPMPNGIKRVEKRVVRNDGGALPGRVNSVVGGIEGFYRVTVEHPSRQCEWQFGSALGVKFLTLIGGMVAAKEDATRVLPGETVEPRHSVFEATVALAAQVEKSVQGLKGDGLGVDPGTGHAFELNICPGDYAGQTEPTNSGAQHVGILFGIADHQTVVRAMQADLADMSAEGSSAVMVLTVDVVGDGSADGDEARAGRDGKEPSFREEYAEDVGEADAAFAAEHAS